MIVEGRVRPWRVSFLITILLVSVGSAALAQDDPEDLPAVPMVRTAEIAESNFDRWVYGNGLNHVTARIKLDLFLELKIEDVDRSSQLSQTQKEKLLLAGRGDIKHFLDRVDRARTIFQELKRDSRQMPQILQETQPLAAQFQAGIFGDESFVGKTIRTTLRPGQVTRFQAALDEKIRFRYQSRVWLTVSNLDNIVGFTTEQRQRLVELILGETRPIEKSVGQYETSVVLVRIARIPEEKIRPLFDNDRWKLLSRQLEQARGQEKFLELNGYLEKSSDQKED